MKESAVKAHSMKDSGNLALVNYGECRASGNGMAGLDMAVLVMREKNWHHLYSNSVSEFDMIMIKI